MSERGRGGEEPDAGEPPTAPGRRGTAEANAPGEGDSSIGISALSLVDKGKGPLTPTTPTTLDAATTGTESEHSSIHGKDEGASSPAAESEKPRQVIAVSVSKGPSAFFNLARKFLVTDDLCDLSALEGAIVSAVDAAHLLERSKIATIVRIQTSYVAVEPKRRHGLISSISEEPRAGSGTASTTTATGTLSGQLQASGSSSPAAGGSGRMDQSRAPGSGGSSTSPSPGKHKSPGSMRRARIVITVKRTEAYKKWLVENPIHDTHAGHDDEHI